MHMADALISPQVGVTMSIVSIITIALVITKLKDQITTKMIPLMGIMGAFVFAAQMINFTIPGTGSSGHLVGSILLCAILGPLPAVIVITSVLIIQSLFFADGGLLALGCNIFNMGIIPCLIVYPLVFRLIVAKRVNAGTLTLAAVVSSIIALELGAFSVTVMTSLSGITMLPFGAFLATMTIIHLPISIIEGLVTGAVLSYVFAERHELIEVYKGEEIGRVKTARPVMIVLLVAALIVGGLISLLASAYPDGLEWSAARISGVEEIEGDGSSLHDRLAAVQEKFAFMPDYDYKTPGTLPVNGVTTAGIVGSLITLTVAVVLAFLIKTLRRRKYGDADSSLVE